MKKLSMFVICFILIFAGTSCSKQLEEFARTIAAAASDAESSSDDDYAYEESAKRIEADTEYTNSYLGFSFTVPKDYWLYSVNESNFAPNLSVTENIDTFDISYGEDYSYIDLISFANLQDSRSDNHIGFDISAELIDDVNSIDKYMEYYEAYLLEPDENTYELIDSTQMEINGEQYEARYIEVIREEEDNYNYLTLTREVDNHYYLTIMTNYWPDNRNAEKIIIDSLSKAMK
jgi:hypothetical protein